MGRLYQLYVSTYDAFAAALSRGDMDTLHLLLLAPRPSEEEAIAADLGRADAFKRLPKRAEVHVYRVLAGRLCSDTG